MNTEKYLAYSETSKKTNSISSCGLTKGIINSIAVYVYSLGEKNEKDVIDIFNGWADACDYKTEKLEEILFLLDFIRKLKKLKNRDLKIALEADYIIKKST